MGVGLSCSCFGPPRSHAEGTLPNAPVPCKDSRSSASITSFLKSRCLGTEKHDKVDNFHPIRTEREKDQEKSERKLGDWLLESSLASNESHTHGEWHVLKNLANKRVHSSKVNPRDSFSNESLLKAGDDCDGSELLSSSFKRSPNGKTKKRVSFKAPEDDEIIIFTNSVELMED